MRINLSIKEVSLILLSISFSVSTWAQEDASLRASEVQVLKTIPSQLKEVIINDQRDISDHLTQLTRGPSESLRFDYSEQIGNQTLYVYREWINDIRSDNLVQVWVDNDTRIVKRFRGEVRRNRQLPTTPELSEKQAVQLVLAYINRGGERLWDEAVIGKGKHQSQLLYQGEELWWGIGIELEVAPDEEETHEWFLVSPEGKVQPWVEGGVNHLEVQVCDGSGTTSSFCSDSQTPIVINHAGQCQPGYTCSGSSNKYQTPWDTANAVEDMWEDVRDSTGCCDVGSNNQHYGGDVEINVGGNTGTGEGSYTAYRMGPSQIRRAVITVSYNWADEPRLTAHEMGHAYHAKESWQTYKLPGTGGTLAQMREHAAVIESIADINAVIFQNYTGSGFSVPPNYVTISGHDYSSQFGINNMTGAYDAYYNARVGGHAFYELAEAVGFRLASKIFLLGVNYLWDDDSNNKISFAEMRQAELDAANAMNLDVSIVNAIKDAWNNVGVGIPGSGDEIQDPNDPPPPGSPVKPNYVDIALLTACTYPWTGYRISYQNVPGASYFDVFHSFGSGYQMTGSTSLNPVTFYSNATATVKVRACNSYGCSALSTDTVTATYLCQ